MNIDHLIADIQRERAERRTHWALFRTIPMDVLDELIKKDLDPSVKASLAEFILLRRRRVRARLERDEKLGEYLERLAVPAAAAIGFIGSICIVTLDSSVMSPAWRTATTVCFNVLGSIAWFVIRQRGIKLVLEARKQLTVFGKVD